MAFGFSGQGSYSRRLLRDLYADYPQTWPYFHHADETSRRFLECEFLPLVKAASDAEHDEWLRAHPDLDQIGIYLGSALAAQVLMQAGREPDLLIGHSFGELAALATAGVYTIQTGVQIVCQRVISLQAAAEAGRMAALSCDYERAKAAIAKLGDSSLEISVLNHPRQTVVSGSAADLERLSREVAQHGLSLTLIKSRYPYHSSHLRRAVRPFAAFLKSYDFRPPAIPVFLSMEGAFYAPAGDLAHALSSQFVRPLDFTKVVAMLHESGCREFIECGGADIVTRIVTQNLAGNSDIAVRSTADALAAVKAAAAKPVDSAASGPPAQPVSTAPSPRAVAAPAAPPPTARPAAAAAAAPARNGRTAAVRPSRPPAISGTAVAATRGVVPRREDRTSKPVDAAGAMDMPIAIVSMGCMLPGADDPEQYWTNICAGRSGIVNLADEEPAAARDFLVADGNGQVTVVPDKTYTLLHGSIVGVPYQAELLSHFYSRREFDELSKSQRLLAAATAQSLSRLARPVANGTTARIQCVLGSTADGCREYDEALFNESLQAIVASLEEPESLRRPLAAALEEIAGYRTGASRGFAQYRMHAAVMERLLRHPVKTYVVDAACSSSLYSVSLGMKTLQDGEADVVLAGGVFAPGPANNALFAQFRGLTPRESRPFDADADGVVFGDGAGLVILKRLPDALAHGDRIAGVIRAVGLSSDGKSPSINVPRSDGQAIAIRRAYERAGIKVDTIQYVEAHATATPVGDAVEFNALRSAFADRDRSLPAVQLGSVKALIGHTGWAAGVASVIKLCKAFEARRIPKQYHYAVPNREIDLAGSSFAIADAACDWPENADGQPRRAAINGFGFGGTNAHMILEAFDSAYHTQLRIRPATEPPRRVFALVGIGSLFPPDAANVKTSFAQRKFDRKSLRLPRGKMLLPDVTEQMDASQYLAGMAAEAAFSAMPELSPRLKISTGIVLGLESKTERGVAANGRIFIDRLRRRFGEHAGRLAIPQADAARILEALVARLERRNPPSGPYTLPGLMPNVAAGRIASLFDLNGPNLIIDMAERSLVQAVAVAGQLLAHGDCDLALTGGISANGAAGDGRAEAVLLMALATPETAQREGLPVLATLTLGAADADEPDAQAVPAVDPAVNYCGASGAREIARAVDELRANGSRHRVAASRNAGPPLPALLFAPPGSAAAAKPAAARPRAPAIYAYVQGTPITWCTPRLVAAPATEPAISLRGRRVVFLTDQPEVWRAIQRSGALDGLAYTVISPAGVDTANALRVDLSAEETVQTSLHALDGTACDTLIALKSLKGRAANSLLVEPFAGEVAWIDLLFAVCRHYYEKIRDGGVSVAAITFDPPEGRQPDPYTGLVAGFMKSLARELPDGVCRVVNAHTGDFATALRFAEIELGQSPGGSPDEVHYPGGERHVVALTPFADPAGDRRSYLDAESVVIAAGGGRGVTAVLAERLLTDFGCRVIAAGRTDPASVPDELRGMDDEALQRHETKFYQDGLARNKGAKIADLKRQFLGVRAAAEICEATRQLQAIGKYEYRRVDLTDAAASAAFVDSIYRDHGRVDLVLYGAGVQVSKMLAKKSLQDFRRIVATKLGGLGNLYRACEQRRHGRQLHYHLLTSAFSYFGNDGQCDYGAANEAMNRLAEAMNVVSSAGHWSSLAWLGWAGIGMTRDSEFAALAASRGLRGVSKAEGQGLFSALMKGAPTAAANVLIAPGEVDFYKLRVVAAAEPAAPAPSEAKSPLDALTLERAVSVRTNPFLLNHLVDNVPTVPGALTIAVVAEAAQKLRPDLKIVAFERAHFHRFIKIYGTKEAPFRVRASVVSEEHGETLVRVCLLADFIHRNGTLLQKDVLQHQGDVRLATAVRQPPEPLELAAVDGRRLPDPYVMEGSAVSLSGPFRTMSNIRVGPLVRRADYRLPQDAGVTEESGYSLATIMLMDSLWRFGAIEMAADGSLPLHVPEKCEIMKLYFDFTRADPRRFTGALTLAGANPRHDGDRLHIGPVAACDAQGNVLLSVENGTCRRFGEIRHGLALQATGT